MKPLSKLQEAMLAELQAKGEVRPPVYGKGRIFAAWWRTARSLIDQGLAWEVRARGIVQPQAGPIKGDWQSLKERGRKFQNQTKGVRDEVLSLFLGSKKPLDNGDRS